MFSGHRISGNTSRKRDLVVHLPKTIFQSSFVLAAFDSIISFLLRYFILNSAENLMPLSQSHPIVLQCFQFAWKIIHVNNSPLFMSYLPKSCQRATQCKPCYHKVSVHLKAWSDLPSVNSNELKVLGTCVKSDRVLRIFLISLQVTLSISACASSLWPKYSCLCHCWPLCFRGRPPVILHGNGRCSAHSARERYFLSCHQVKILVTDVT